MKYKRFLFLALLTLLVVFGVGCEDDDLTAEEVLLKTINATEGINATVFDMEMTQQYNVPGMGAMSLKSFINGRAIEKPMAAEFDMDMEAAGEKVNMKMYLVDDLLYMNMPELGWVYVDVSEEIAYADTYEDPFEYIHLLHELSADSITVEEDNDYYTMTYTDDTGELAALLKEEVEAQLKADFFGGAAAEPELEDLLSTMEFSDLFYQVKIDVETFLPVENTIAFTTEMEMMGEDIDMDQTIKVSYLEFDTFDNIDVPEVVINEAIALDALF